MLQESSSSFLAGNSWIAEARLPPEPPGRRMRVSQEGEEVKEEEVGGGGGATAVQGPGRLCTGPSDHSWTTKELKALKVLPLLLTGCLEMLSVRLRPPLLLGPIVSQVLCCCCCRRLCCVEGAEKEAQTDAAGGSRTSPGPGGAPSCSFSRETHKLRVKTRQLICSRWFRTSR